MVRAKLDSSSALAREIHRICQPISSAAANKASSAVVVQDSAGMIAAGRNPIEFGDVSIEMREVAPAHTVRSWLSPYSKTIRNRRCKCRRQCNPQQQNCRMKNLRVHGTSFRGDVRSLSCDRSFHEKDQTDQSERDYGENKERVEVGEGRGLFGS